MKREKTTDNFIFRFFRCGLSLEKTCKLCDVSQKTVEGWDRGNPIPEHRKRLMELYSGLRLDHLHDDWAGWIIRGPWMITPYGEKLRMRDILYMSIQDRPDRDLERARRGLRRKRR